MNSLKIDGLTISNLYLLIGSYLNIEYELPNGARVKLLKDKYIYFANQIEIDGKPFCYGVVADKEYLLISKYEENGTNGRIVIYKKLD